MAKQSDPIFVLVRMLGLPVFAGIGGMMMCRPPAPDAVGNQFAVAGFFLLAWAVLAFVQVVKNGATLAEPSKLPVWAQAIFLTIMVPAPGIFCYEMISIQAPKAIIGLIILGFAITALCGAKSAASSHANAKSMPIGGCKKHAVPTR